MSANDSEILAAYELERLLHKAASTRFERTLSGFVCANADLPSVWSASRANIEPDGELPTLDQFRELTEMPQRWHRGLRHRTALIAGTDEGRELAYSAAREGWDVTELWLMICRTPPKVPRMARRVEGAAMRRLKARLGVEHGLPPASVEQFDRFDDLRGRAAARFAFAGFDGEKPQALASAFLRGDIAVLEDVATFGRARSRGYGAAAVRGATAAALRLSARAVYLFTEPELARGFYEPLGFERIAGAWDCEKAPPGEGRVYK